MAYSILLFDLIVAMLFVSGLSMAGLGLYGRRFVKRIPAATPYVVLMFSAAGWAVLYALDLLAPTLPQKIAYHNLRFLFLPFFSVLELWFVVAYVKRPEWLRRDRAALALIVPVIACVLALTSPFHTLFRYNFSINTAGPVPFLQYSGSPFFTFYSLYSLALVVLAVGMLVVEKRKQGTLLEMQTLLVLLALAIPTVLNYAFQAGLTPVQGVNMTPVLLWVMAVLYTVALFRYHFLDIVPVARSRLIETMSAPVIVLDTGGRIIDLNPAACQFFSHTSSSAIGRKIGEIVPDWPDFLEFSGSAGTRRADLTRHLDSGDRYYSVSTEPLLTRSGEIEGQILLIQDITSQKTADQALHESESRFRQLADATVEGIVLHKGGIIRDLNERACGMFGYSREEMIGRDIFTLITPESVEQVRQNVARAYDKSYEARLLRRDGSTVWAEIRGHTFISGNETLRIATFWDITERRAAGAAIRESEEKFRALVETTSDFIWEVDGAGRYTYVSPRVREMLGYEPQEMIGRTPFDFMPGDEASHVASEYTKLVESRLPINALENKCVRRDGAVVVLETSGMPKYSKDGSFDGYRGIDRDITQRRQVEEALREKTEELDQYFTTSLDLFCIADTDGYFRRLNPEWEKTLGYTLAELEGRRFLDFVHPDDLRETLDAIADLSSQKEVLNFTNRYRHKDGTYRWIEWRSFPKGNLIFAAARDITKRKAAEKALAEAEEKYRTLVEYSQSIIFTILPSGVYTFVSPSWTKLLGHEPSEVVGHDCREFIHEDDLPKCKMCLKRTLETGEMQPGVEYRIFHKNGSVRWFRTIAVPVYSDGGTITSFVGNALDFTDRKMAEDALRESEEKYRTIIENMQDIFYRTDLAGNITMISPSASVIAGYDLDKLIGSDVLSVYADPEER
ncbi:MAG: PAS domain S-box protein, partial [Methanoregulaceae archaeon]|nr:PAS domain S-box protein [Methanoregulaceae archaeon]